MKPSKNAMFCYILGFVVMLVSFVYCVVDNNQLTPLIGSASLNMLWLFGILEDLYKSKENTEPKENNKP